MTLACEARGSGFESPKTTTAYGSVDLFVYVSRLLGYGLGPYNKSE